MFRSSHSRRVLKRSLRVLAGAVVALALLTAVTPHGRAGYKAALFVTQVIPPVPSVSLFQPDSTRERITFQSPEGPRDADIYRPEGDGPYAAVVLFLGVAPAGPDDPRLVNLGNALARSGMVTMVYWSPDKLDGRIHPPDVHNLVAAYEHLQSRPYVDEDRVGFGGFCVGASFSLMAAAQPEINSEVAFVNAFGPYYDLERLLLDYGTRTRVTDSGDPHWEIDKLTRRVARTMLLDELPSEEADQVAHALDTGSQPPDGLSEEARAAYRILAGGTEPQVRAAAEALPASAHELFRAASPSHVLDQVKAPVSLMHDRGDDLVPAHHSRLTAEALREHGAKVRHTEFSLFEHVDPSASLGPIETASEVWKFFTHLYGIMRIAT
ncbi:MAG: alpha/beta hydrolase family protein [Chloroflexota bacterium]